MQTAVVNRRETGANGGAVVNVRVVRAKLAGAMQPIRGGRSEWKRVKLVISTEPHRQQSGQTGAANW